MTIRFENVKVSKIGTFQNDCCKGKMGNIIITLTPYQ